MGLRDAIARHRLATAIVATLVVAGLAVVVFWFEPQKLFIDEAVDEAVPGTVAEDDQDSGRASGTEPKGGEHAQTIAMGKFRALNHEATGDASILKLGQTRFLRFENFEVENGPDLRVYLSSEPAEGDSSRFDDDFIDLGGLKGNIGDQNYRLPSGVDLERYTSAVVWCRRFSVGFAVADLAT